MKSLEDIANRIQAAEDALRFYADPQSYHGLRLEAGGWN